jgi:hypothetical protein
VPIQRGDNQIHDETTGGPVVMLGPIKLAGAAALVGLRRRAPLRWRFGPSYDEYGRKSWALIPGLF